MTTNTTATSISVAELNTNGFPYCQTLSVTVTSNTPVGPVSSGAASDDVLFQIPGIYNCYRLQYTLYLAIMFRSST